MFRPYPGMHTEISKDGQRILTNELPPTDLGKLGARLMQKWPAALNR